MTGDRVSHLSLRDPNSVQTLSAFRRGVDWAKSGQFTQQDIDEAKLSVFSAVDSPVAPADKGDTPTVMNPLNKVTTRDSRWFPTIN